MDPPATDSALDVDLERALLERFGLSSFRDGQREVIAALLGGEDALVVRPTGSGKSLCYQLPAFLVPGVTVVVSPLIALMKDQIDALADRGLPAIAIHSGLGPSEAADALAAVRAGRARLLYVAPERFRVPSFLEVLSGAEVSILAIDEAHCVSEWGHEFRPDYRRLGAAREALGRPATIALTATATARVRRDILDELRIPDARVFVSGFDRPNLAFSVLKAGRRDEKLAALRALVRNLGSNGAGIIYCATRKRAEELALGLGVGLYHAGLEPGERARIQDAFMEGTTGDGDATGVDHRVLVATNAFGMGIDRPDIRFVAHAEMPRSLEAYVQEAGRAGRDGAPARCVLLYGYADRLVHDFFIDEGSPEPELVRNVWRLLRPELGPGLRPGETADGLAERVDSPPRRERSRRARPQKPRGLAVAAALKLIEKAGHVALRRDRRQPLIEVLDAAPADELRIDWTTVEARRAYERERLERMIAYASRDRCRTREILRYFGDGSPAAFKGTCGHCDVCGSEEPAADGIACAPQEAAAGDLPVGADEPSTVARKVLSCVARMGGEATRSAVAGCLAGSRAARVHELGHDHLSTYGILRDLGRGGVLLWVDALARTGLLRSSGGRVVLTASGIDVMAGRSPLPALRPKALREDRA